MEKTELILHVRCDEAMAMQESQAYDLLSIALFSSQSFLNRLHAYAQAMHSATRVGQQQSPSKHGVADDQ